GPQDCIAEMRARYRARRDVLIEGLEAAGWAVPRPPASMFAWAPLPARFEGLGSLGVGQLLLAEAKVAGCPAVRVGEHGEGYVRLALVENEHRIRHAVRNVKAFLRNADALLAAKEGRRSAS